MSDFLDRILGRTLGGPGVIRPRPVARFEAAAGPPGPASVLFGSRGGAPGGPAQDDDGRPPTAGPPSPDGGERAARDGRGRADTQRGDPGRGRRPDPSEPLSSASDRAGREARERARWRTGSTPAQAGSAGGPPVTPEPRDSMDLVERRPALRPPAPHPPDPEGHPVLPDAPRDFEGPIQRPRSLADARAPEETLRTATPRSEGERTAPGPSSHEPSEAVGHGSSSTPLAPPRDPVGAVTRGLMRDRRGPERDQVETPASTGPDIRVTIGRIEVRAVGAPARRAEGMSGSGEDQDPVMGLDEYLAERGRDGTRGRAP